MLLWEPHDTVDEKTALLYISGSQPLGHGPFAGWITLSQGWHKIIRKYRYLHYGS